ncbi:MAG: glutathione synthase, partial [Gammaproteobacteria bacterium]
MSIKLGIIMDPLPSINIKKDSSFAMMLAAQRKGWEIHTIYQPDLYTKNEIPHALSRVTRVKDNASHWFDFEPEQDVDLTSLDAILMRKDPPFDIEYITSTYILQLAEQSGTLIVNKPASLRDNNEKMFITR